MPTSHSQHDLKIITRDHAAWNLLYNKNNKLPIWHTLPFLNDFVDIFKKHRCYKILDAACGDGGQMVGLPDELLTVGIDQSRNAISDAERHLKHAGRKNYVLLNSLIEDTPFPDATFDGILFVDALLCLADPLPTLHEFSRLMKKGGICITTTFTKSDPALETLSTLGLDEKFTLYNDVFITRLEESEKVASWFKERDMDVISCYTRTDIEDGHRGYREDKHSHERLVIIARKG